MRFESPFWLLLLIPYIAMIVFQLRKDQTLAIKFSDISIFRKIEHRHTKYIAHAVQYARYFILFLMIITLARPQLVDTNHQIKTKGIDIMMVLDTSGSMAAEDFKPKNRLEAAKETMKNFVSKRHTDHIGLIVFGEDAYTLAPLSTDYSIIGNFFDDIQLSMAGDGTSIGMALATGLNRLKSSKSKTKIMVLLTDGENNSGEIDPIRAAELARDINIKVYTIGIGKEGGAPIPYMHPVFGKQYSSQLTYLDEDTLKSIAKITNGAYFRATDTKSLETIYAKIDALEKTIQKSKQHVSYLDLFTYLLSLLVGLMILEICLYNLFLVVVP